MGDHALHYNSGNYNTAVGRLAGYCSIGSNNVYIGYKTACISTSANYNTFVGNQSGIQNTVGDCHTSLGSESGPSTCNLTNTIAIGYCVSVAANNYTCIGNSATVCSVVPNISTNCFTTGAFMESNLSSFEIKGNPTGTVLIWKDGKAIPCEEEYDVTVLGVAADNNESPIIIGAEPVLVTGPINEGDFIVTSDKRGHGKKGFSNNLFGKVIAQALESGDGDSYTIKAMIRKM